MKAKNLLADTCAANFPSKGDTTFLPGELRVDTLVFPSDTLLIHDTIKVVCPPSIVIKQRVVDTVRIKVVDSAFASSLRDKITFLENQLILSNKEKEKLIVRLDKSKKIALVSVLINAILLLIGFLISRKWK